MKLRFLELIIALCLSAASGALAGISKEQAASLPPPVEYKVDFVKEIKPIFEASCTKCHGRGKAKGGFRLDDRDAFLKGGDDGPSIVLNKSAESHLIELVAGFDPEKIMPEKGSRLTPKQISLLRTWIDQGAVWDQSVTFAKPPAVNLIPRLPQIPPARGGTDLKNPVDLFLQSYFETHGTKPAKLVDDRTFARRAYLDIIGLLPLAEDLQAFMDDQRPHKRTRLVKSLLADNQRYAENWLTFWNDMLRNDYRGTGYIDGGREQISYWLFNALASNMPFDQFVAQLINPGQDSQGFTKGIVWRGVVNASQVPQMQAAQNISQVFMGVNLKCASCHDSFINDWTLAESYGLASIYADEPLEMFKCDKPTGQKASMKFIYPQLGDLDPVLSKSNRLQRLAEIITGKHDGRFTRAIVNRFWARFMGRGLVEPVDEMENPAWHQDLLDWLAADLADNGFDLKCTLEWILTSQAYQLPAVDMGEAREKEYVFRGPAVRRLGAEQFRDALAEITGVYYSFPAAVMGVASNTIVASLAENKSSVEAIGMQPRWIWKEDTSAQDATDLTLYFRKTVILPEAPTAAAMIATCDGRFTLYVNGKEVSSGRGVNKPKLVNVKDQLVKGTNLIAVQAVNETLAKKAKRDGEDEDKDEKKPVSTEKKPNPAGFILQAWVRHTEEVSGIPVETVMDFGTDMSWTWTTAKFSDWEKPEFQAEGWVSAADLGNAAIAPWHMEKKLASGLSAAQQYKRTRAALVAADSLALALGRPNREQVMTVRSAAATTLQALELTNGGTLDELLKRGAEKLVNGNPGGSVELVDRIYMGALGRKPTLAEAELAKEVVGSPAKQEGVEDLLWSVAMLPEFQLIY